MKSLAKNWIALVSVIRYFVEIDVLGEYWVCTFIKEQ